jgi:hypothetical protein
MPKHEKPFHLDIPFDEALRRYAQSDPNELRDQKHKTKKREMKRAAADQVRPTPIPK